MKECNLGTINGHAVGRILKEAVRRAINTIRNERLVFEAHVKESYGGTMDDVFTSADQKAQEVYLRTIRECFPNCGVIAEEDSVVLPTSNGCTAYFTVDALDGTKAFVRRQSHGVGTMIALVDGGEVISAFIGDINTQEIYGYRPGSDNVHRIMQFDTAEVLKAEESLELHKRYALLRSPAEDYRPVTRKLLTHFKKYEVIGSSIGIWMAQLWKREVAAAFLKPGWETPWDSTPILGISRKLGYVFLRQDGKGGWKEYDPVTPTEKYYRQYDTVVVHRNDVRSLFGK